MKEVIETFEPRVRNVSVLFGDVERNEMEVTVFYNITDGVKNQDLTFTVTRAR
jgi:predicted component of type VI protein secretion system